MHRYLVAAAACCWGALASADDCPLPAPQSKVLAYERGPDLSVMTGAYQFELPARPDALLAFDGVMAVLSERHYVSYQLISNETVGDVLSRFSDRQLSAAALDRYLYGLDAIADLSPQDQSLIQSLRSDLKLDCHSQLTRYVVGGIVEVVLQEPEKDGGEYRLLYFAGETTHLVSVKGTKAQALAVLKSIRKRKL